ncbi:bifunctional riboflavin kinase/FAD synthetase [Flavobacterium sp. GSP27]|uniref:bifunctional riboflavin kinase/FAD synthetase n=1 Tax=unclassified Flavobacterium TaxID=196869 RepID=UPI000F82C724|nr:MULTISPECIES: bifunctional riboflavin kinase/FAD synthetase [unclassified Flavobacterium]RTY96172.1 bifunctional riboflavin kinase/FAD synthetase [Flavobacterium sp. GSN2]RTY81889.1 bifunctional riboflavin kinase/FAD synthetase [Flavobacterium sp. ZB4P23]RTY84071.1 bifunctional riboflavin kinase/FAD synthetase [Flavobacterium sp. LS1P28]RTY92822.1 bifunctional riboflavin kinase/FAD synthetase [Flavobacterium sp. RSP46]RTZ11327.1 bifunctional riboflavin kinase/FAD synthetase [Flavobacterium 
MKIFHSINDFVSPKKTILTLGTFDGVHIGHKKILNKLTQNTENENYESLVLTFFPHPRMVLQEHSDLKLLNTITEKIDLLEKIGIENLVIHPFDETFSRLTAEEFVSTILVDRFHIHKIIIGHDHRFGRNRTADIDDLIAFGKEYNFEVEQISVQEINAISVSSTKIRKALLEGDMALANEYLGYDYSLTGKIIQGKQLGRTIGFPTANLKIEENYKLIPQNGVYIVQSSINQKTVFGMMNIGFNPTVDGQNQSIEIHYFDFDADLYNQDISVSILQRIRSEQKFESVDVLKEQLEKDKKTALAYWNKY